MCSSELINGDVYIQRGVRKTYYNKDIDDEYIHKFSLDVTKRVGYCIDIRGVDSFYKICFDECNVYRIYQYDKYGNFNRCIELDNISYEEIDKRYIKLSDFLKNAEYVGREFKRIKPVITYYSEDVDKFRIIDNTYLELDGYNNKYIVLYEKDNTFLVRYKFGYKEGYSIIDCRYVQDGMYKLDSFVYEEYRDRNLVYDEIVKQIDNSVKRRIRCK